MVGRDVGQERDDGRQAAVGRAHVVPEVGHRAAHAAVARADVPAGTLAIADRRAVGHGLGPLAADLVQAPALLRPFVPPGERELAELEERPALALVVDEVPVHGERPAHRVRGRHFAEREVVDDRRDQVLDVQGTAREGDQLPAPHEGSDTAGAGLASAGPRHPAIERARAHGQRCQGPGAHLADDVGDRPSADQAEGTAGTGRDATLDHGDVAVRITLHRVGAGQLGRGARRREERLVVLHRQRLEQQRGDGRVRGAKERLRVPAAALTADPDDGEAGSSGNRSSDSRRVAGWEREGGGHRRRELEERPTGHSPPHQCGVQPVLAHRVPHQSGRCRVRTRCGPAPAAARSGNARTYLGRHRGCREVPEVAAMGGEGPLDRALMAGMAMPDGLSGPGDRLDPGRNSTRGGPAGGRLDLSPIAARGAAREARGTATATRRGRRS